MEREKVIKGLECIAGYIVFCANCKYSDVNGSGRGDRCKRDCAKDAIALLKAQAPKVMTLEEVDALSDDDIVWLECLYTFDGKKTATLKPAIYQSDNSSPEEDGYYCVVSSWGQSGFYHKDNYMGDWRCWTSRPTDEQREKVKWE
jgi:hypothetical protein